MSADRWVRWPPGYEGPTREELGTVLHDYIDESGYVQWEDESNRFWITFATRRVEGAIPRARHSEAFRRAGSVTGAAKGMAIHRHHDDVRSIEVFIHDDCVDVITRMADDFTSGVAARLAEVLARLFGGTVEAG